MLLIFIIVIGIGLYWTNWWVERRWAVSMYSYFCLQAHGVSRVKSRFGLYMRGQLHPILYCSLIGPFGLFKVELGVKGDYIDSSGNIPLLLRAKIYFTCRRRWLEKQREEGGKAVEEVYKQWQP